MNVKKILEAISKQKRKNDRAKSAKKIAIAVAAVGAASLATGVVYAKQIKKQSKNFADQAKDTVEEIHDEIQTQANIIKDSAENTIDRFDDGLDDFQRKNAHIRNDMNEGFHKVKKTIDNTTENIANEIKK